MIIAWLLLKSNDFVVKRVKIALLFNDKYKQGYSYIMPQYTSSDTAAQGTVVNAVLDTVTNTVTYTVTTPAGLSTSVTAPASQNPQSSTALLNSIRQQLAAQQGGSLIIPGLTGYGQSLNATWGSVTEQSEKATVTSEATGTPPPAESNPIPVSPENNTSPTPEPSEPSIENNEPATIADPNADEFDGIDTQVANNENALQEPPQLSDEEVDNYFDQFQQEEQIENREPPVEENVFNPGTTFNAGEENVFNPEATGGDSYGSSKGLTGGQQKSRSTATSQDVSNFKQKEDWRVRLSLAPSADYLYKAKTPEARGILDPLAKTDGVIFPYTPAISVQYAAHYDQTELTHSNFKYFQYKSSSVDKVSITCDFTAQDTNEARYVLAVIHFFRSVTKMFYGQDNGPKPGTPPPLCYLSGLGEFQFDAHPLAITAFNYSLPTDVDYIRAGSVSALAGVNQSRSNNPVNSSSAADSRRTQAGLNTGATANGPNWSNLGSTRAPTYVPTKMQMQITAVPIVTRYDISQKFSLAEYGTGKLLQGTVRSGGGIW